MKTHVRHLKEGLVFNREELLYLLMIGIALLVMVLSPFLDYAKLF